MSKFFYMEGRKMGEIIHIAPCKEKPVGKQKAAHLGSSKTLTHKVQKITVNTRVIYDSNYKYEIEIIDDDELNDQKYPIRVIESYEPIKTSKGWETDIDIQAIDEVVKES
jgi:hypothetical protein